MNGPFPPGTWTSDAPASDWSWERGRITRGHKYRVIRPFTDAHGDRHSIGEEWTFIRSMFSKFDDEIILCVRSASGDEWAISLLWKAGSHDVIIENIHEYVETTFE
jgi:hypothetical protein